MIENGSLVVNLCYSTKSIPSEDILPLFPGRRNQDQVRNGFYITRFEVRW